MHTIKITPNLLSEYKCTSGKFITLSNRIESKLFSPELECSGGYFKHGSYPCRYVHRDDSRQKNGNGKRGNEKLEGRKKGNTK